MEIETEIDAIDCESRIECCSKEINLRILKYQQACVMKVRVSFVASLSLPKASRLLGLTESARDVIMVQTRYWVCLFMEAVS